ncbi:unnamed protein product, partial [Choristocarpus tenellus]
LYSQWWWKLVQEDPEHVIVETALIVFIVYILVVKKTVNPKGTAKPNLSEREMKELIEEWQPEPLVPPLSEEEMELAEDVPVVEEVNGPFFKVQGSTRPLLNMATFDFLGMGQQKETKDAAVNALNKVGCGSCCY